MTHNATLVYKFNFLNTFLTELNSKMLDAITEGFLKDFTNVWPQHIISYIIAITDSSNNLTGTGIFYSPNAFITHSDVITQNTSSKYLQTKLNLS